MKLSDFRLTIQQSLHGFNEACEQQLQIVLSYSYHEDIDEIECQIHDAYDDMIVVAYPHGERVTADYTINHIIEIHEFLPSELEELTEEQFQAQNEEVVSWLQKRWLNVGGDTFHLPFSITFHDEE